MRPAARVAASVKSELTRNGGKRLIEDINAAHCFVLVYNKRWINTDNLRIRHRDEAALQCFVEKSSGDGLIQRRLGRAIGNQFNANHQSTPTHVSNKAVFVLQPLQRIDHQRADTCRIFDQLFIEDDLNGAKAGGSGKRISAVAGRTSARLSEWFSGHAIEGRGNGTEGKAAADPLADRHNVGLEIELFGRPHRSGSAEAGQDFICDEKRAEFICDFSHGVNEIVGRDDVARRALHWLQNYRCNLALGIVLHDVA